MFGLGLQHLNNVPNRTATSLGDVTASDDQKVANLFAQHFPAAFSTSSVAQDEALDYHVKSLSKDDPDLEKPLLVQDVMRALQEFDGGKGVDTVGIPSSSSFFKRTTDILALPLTIIYNNSLRIGIK